MAWLKVSFGRREKLDTRRIGTATSAEIKLDGKPLSRTDAQRVSADLRHKLRNRTDPPRGKYSAGATSVVEVAAQVSSENLSDKTDLAADSSDGLHEHILARRFVRSELDRVLKALLDSCQVVDRFLSQLATHVNSSCCDGNRGCGAPSSDAGESSPAGAHSTSEGRGPGGSDSDVPGRDDQGGDQS